jgi:hypothetical protein
MSQQYNKVQKRQRRKAYLKRRKAAARPKTKTKTKAAPQAEPTA